VSGVVFYVGLALTGRLEAVPRSVMVLDWMSMMLMAGGLRFAARWLREGSVPWRAPDGRRVLVVGAGEAAERLLRQIRHDNMRSLHVVGLVDDDESKQHMSLHGVPVLGLTRQLSELASRHRAELIVIAVPSASPEQLRRIVSCCLQTKLEFKKLPSMRDILEGRASVSELTPVALEHLLVRDPVTFDDVAVRKDLQGQTVLITGGAGSVGSELSRQIATLRPGKLILLEQAETSLYYLRLELARNFPELDVRAIVGDITEVGCLERVFAAHTPACVFHAAAYKHVPMMEENPSEAIRNNVLGTLRVAEAAARHGAGKFVLVSTDKAVNPSSVMGATKRIAERLVLEWPSLIMSGMDRRAVRFGNVLGSDGSVVPLFRRQLAAGGPITVTHPEVTRYFMTLTEAAQLVLQAAALPECAGRIAMLEMGESVSILEMAENLVRLSGLEPYRDVKIEFTGLRPGEKLHEELMSGGERAIPTSLDKIRIVQTSEPDGRALTRGVAEMFAALERRNPSAVRAYMCALVPECQPPLKESAKRNIAPTWSLPAPELARVRAV